MLQGTCSQCNAQYNSERELRDHMGRAHRQFSSEPVEAAAHDAPEIVAALQNGKQQDS
jgi:hypothetical protein